MNLERLEPEKGIKLNNRTDPDILIIHLSRPWVRWVRWIYNWSDRRHFGWQVAQWVGDRLDDLSIFVANRRVAKRGNP